MELSPTPVLYTWLWVSAVTLMKILGKQYWSPMEAPCSPQVYSVSWDPLRTVPFGRQASGGAWYSTCSHRLWRSMTLATVSHVPTTVSIQSVLNTCGPSPFSPCSSAS